MDAIYGPKKIQIATECKQIASSFHSNIKVEQFCCLSQPKMLDKVVIVEKEEQNNLKRKSKTLETLQ